MCIADRKRGWQEIRELLSANEAAKKVCDSVKRPGLIQITLHFAARKTIEQLETPIKLRMRQRSICLLRTSVGARCVDVPIFEKQ